MYMTEREHFMHEVMMQTSQTYQTQQMYEDQRNLFLEKTPRLFTEDLYLKPIEPSPFTASPKPRMENALEKIFLRKIKERELEMKHRVGKSVIGYDYDNVYVTKKTV